MLFIKNRKLFLFYFIKHIKNHISDFFIKKKFKQTDPVNS